MQKEEILPDPYSEEAIYIDKNGKILKDLEIEKLNISTRLKNALIKSKILYLSEILGYEKENFLSIKNMGTSTADEAVSLEQNLKIIYVSNVANNALKLPI